jgi:hypothetical protein
MLQSVNKSAKSKGFRFYSSGSYSTDSLEKYARDLKAGRVKSVSPPNTMLNRTVYEYRKKGGKINIKKENRGTFTAKAKARGMSVQEFARYVLNNKDKFTASTIKQANFARNASK